MEIRSKNQSTNFQLEDLLAFYPPQDTPKIQTLFTAKQEFNELKASTTEPVPKKGEFFKHQKLVQRLMRAVDKLLILHEAGTGKTCTMLSVSEFYEMISQTLMGMTNSLLRQGFPIKKTYVLVRNDILRDEFINQLVCTCTVDKYETKFVKDARDERSRMFRIKKEIGRFYEVLTFREFSNQISRLNKEGFDDRGRTIYSVETILSDEQIRKNYSNCLFFADEIHNLRNVEGDFGDIKDKDQESSIINYASLWKVFHTAQNIKIMLATATPMINDPADLVPTLNLILPKDQQVADGTDFAKWSLNRFEKLVRGMVSFVRVLDTGIDVVYEGRNKIEGAYLTVAGKSVEASSIVEASMMSPFQSKGYLEAEIKETRGGKSGGIRKSARHASNFVFPKAIIMKGGEATFDPDELGFYGKEGFEKYVKFENNRYRFTKEFSKLMDDEDAFSTMSSKFLNVIQLCEEKQGNCFCYTDDFAVASGAILLGLCFEKYGYTKYDSNAPVFQILGQKTGGSSFCSKDQDDNVERKINVKPGKRYAILTSDTDRDTIRKIITLFNSKENMNGEYIKVIIASRKAREGLNLANVQNIHLVNPSWNQSNMYQAIFRAIRATSHVELIKYRKAQAIEMGEDPEKVRVEVRIYEHCSILTDDEEIQQYSIDIGKPNYSVELQMYQLSEQKDRNNAVVMRMLKQCAIDCQINQLRNKRDTDIDGTQVCNYMECDYECVDPAPLNLDFTTYDVYYKDELVEKIKERIQELFVLKNQYKTNEILSNINEFPAKFVVQALSEMIKEKTPFVNRFGYTSFLSENGDLFFLMNELNAYSTENLEIIYDQDVKSIGKTEYNENLYAVGKRDFDEMTRQIRKPFDEKKVNELLKDISKTEENMDTNVLVTLIEKLLMKQRNNPLNESEMKVIQKYRNLIYSLREPLTLLDTSKETLSEPTQPKRGRKKKLDAPVKVEKLKQEINIEEIEFGEPVIIHLLDLLKVDKAGYKTTTKFQKGDALLRILKNDENQWRDVTDVEKIAYNQLIQNARKTETERLFGDSRIYGTILQDNVFRIIDKDKENTKAKKNRHYEAKGRECIDKYFYDLTEIMYRLKLTPEMFDLKITDYPKDKDGLEAFLKNKKFNTTKMTKDQMLEAGKWVASVIKTDDGKKETSIQKEHLCALLKKYFEEQQLLYKLLED
jgi:hypothetical protein